MLDTELLSPSAARLYVFGSVDAAAAAEAASTADDERRGNVVVVFAEPPTDADRQALDDCFEGEL